MKLASCSLCFGNLFSDAKAEMELSTSAGQNFLSPFDAHQVLKETPDSGKINNKLYHGVCVKENPFLLSSKV